jgi:hypothetical protein
MTATTAKTPSAQAPAPAPERPPVLGLKEGPGSSAPHLFVRCGDWLMAVPLEAVERVASAESAARSNPPEPELERHSPAWAGSRSRGRAGAVTVNGRNYSAWDLSRMLDGPPPTGGVPATGAYVLMNPAAARPPMALGVTACLRIGPLADRQLSPLPDTMFPGRPGAYRAAFPSEAAGVRSAAWLGPAGLLLDLRRLWTLPELAFARRQLEALRTTATATPTTAATAATR